MLGGLFRRSLTVSGRRVVVSSRQSLYSTSSAARACECMSHFARKLRFACQPVLLRFAAVFKADEGSIKVTFRLPNGKEKVVETPVGSTMLEAAQDNGVDIEGACGGEAACSTCHVIVDATTYAKLPAPSDEELDMLDLATGLTKTCELVAVRGVVRF